MVSIIRLLFCLLIIYPAANAGAADSIDEALIAAGIYKTDSLEIIIDKALWLLNEKRYFMPKGDPPVLRPPYDIPYHLDSMRSPEEILTQKVGGSCGSSALAFAAIVNRAGVAKSDIQIVLSVVNDDLRAICPKAKHPHTHESGARGHVFVAIRFPEGWRLINSIDGSKTYEKAPWYDPITVKTKIKRTPLSIPEETFGNLPKNIYASGLTVFQSWFLDEVLEHTIAQRYDLIASGKSDSAKSNRSIKICRFTAP